MFSSLHAGELVSTTPVSPPETENQTLPPCSGPANEPDSAAFNRASQWLSQGSLQGRRCPSAGPLPSHAPASATPHSRLQERQVEQVDTALPALQLFPQLPAGPAPRPWFLARQPEGDTQEGSIETTEDVGTGPSLSKTPTFSLWPWTSPN